MEKLVLRKHITLRISVRFCSAIFHMKWIQIKSENDLNEIMRLSESTAVLVFKHSTRCSISSMALSRLERNWDESLPFPIFFLDLLSYRILSNKIADLFKVTHQSPQVLIIKNKQALYSASHSDIQYNDVLDVLNNSKN